jgi:hypothetical protein
VWRSRYYLAAKTLWGYALEANAKGDYFPVWGTCLGFQTVAILAAGNQSLLSRFAGVDGASLPLNFTAAAKTSRLFGHAPRRVLETLGSTPSTVNLHHFGVSPEAFAENPALSRGACVRGLVVVVVAVAIRWSTAAPKAMPICLAFFGFGFLGVFGWGCSL